MSELKSLKEDLKEKRFHDIAKSIIQYQNYKSDIAISKMDNSLGKSTRLNYLTFGIKYLKTKEKSKIVPSSLYIALDKLIEQHLQPLRPNFDEQKRIYKRDYTKKSAKPPIVALKAVQKPLTTNFEYGIRIGNDIKILESEDIAKGFIQGLKFAGNNNAILVSVEVQNL